MSSLVVFDLGIQCYDFITTPDSVFLSLKATSYGSSPLHQQMKFVIGTTQAVKASVTIGTSFVMIFIVYTSTESRTPSIQTIAVITVMALW